MVLSFCCCFVLFPRFLPSIAKLTMALIASIDVSRPSIFSRSNKREATVLASAATSARLTANFELLFEFIVLRVHS
jgi:hypothetical protein